MRGIGKRREAVEGRLELAAVRGDEPVALELDAEALAGEPELGAEVLEVERRIGVGGVLPDAHVGDDRGVPRLAQIGRAGQERHAPVGRDDEALEEAEAERVVAGRPVHRLLLEQQQAVEPRLRHGGEQRALAAVELFRGEVQGHGFTVVSWPGSARPSRSNEARQVSGSPGQAR